MSTNTFLPKNSTILLWKSKSIPSAFVLKTNSQRWIGFVRTDQKGQFYWKFHENSEAEALLTEPALLEEKNLSQNNQDATTTD